MRRKITFTAQADADRDGIWDHSVEQWSVQQAEDYLMGLDRVLNLLADQPQLARERREVVPPARMHPYRSHLVLFRDTETTLDVLRIVHRRSDWQALLGD